MSGAGRVQVGSAGWSYADWEGIVYPREKPRGFHPLRCLSRYLDCVEVNSSFYATPRADFAARWLSHVADRKDFRFSVKLQDVFTHQPLPAEPELPALVEAFLSGIEPLRSSGRLAALLVQFPHGFHHTARGVERLERIEAAFAHLPLVLEVRHRSWFAPDALQTVERLGYSLARIDLPYAADHPPPDPAPVGPIAYLRLHGRNAASWFDPKAGRDRRYDYLYGDDEVDEIARTVRRLATGADETLVITNNHFAGKAVANALEIQAALGREVRAPASLVAAYPKIAVRVGSEGQGTLFEP